MTRSMVLEALLVCSVPNTSTPISAAVMASAMVSMSRISPTRITPGSWRMASAARWRSCLRVGAHLALAEMVHFLFGCTNSTGSSMVMMCLACRVLMQIDDRRQRGRLARAGGPGHQHQALLEVGEAESAAGAFSSSSVVSSRG
jgi:hypothetical protein